MEIGEQDPAARFQSAFPLRQDPRPVGQMDDGIDAGDGVELFVVEGQTLCRIRNPEFTVRTQASCRRQSTRRRDRSFVHINPGQGAPVLCASRNAGPPDPQQTSSNFFPAARDKAGRYWSCSAAVCPTALADVFSKGGAANLAVQFGVEIAVVGVVVVDGWH